MARDDYDDGIGQEDSEYDDGIEQEDSDYDGDENEIERNLNNLRRTLYLIIISAVDFDESSHKLLQIKFKPGQEMELCITLLECCIRERTYHRYYGLLGQRLCITNEVHKNNFEKCFSLVKHQLDTNKLPIMAKFFAHMLSTDALSWHVLGNIRVTAEDTTVSSRLFLKILFQELDEQLGIRLLNERLQDPTMQESFESLFPKDNAKNMKFSINFFTSIGLGRIVENLHQYYKDHVAEVEAEPVYQFM